MSPPPLRLNVGAAELWAVPAVHFRFAFAQAVNRLCSDPATRPDAVAVELGPAAAAAAVGWLRDLGVGPAFDGDLPCMLGLTRINRFVRASLRERAVQLQEATGKDLSELPPDVLKAFLGYSSVTVLYLSPTDSIIEALRCALELGVPVYGVDLDETAEARRAELLIEDPTLAAERVGEYVGRNAAYAHEHRDEEIDGRREVAMAARLKTVLDKHRRVLFTGGLAHWPRLQQLLGDGQVRPAPARPAAEVAAGDYQRVIVHPALAVYHMDIYPAVTQAYQKCRARANKVRVMEAEQTVDPPQLFARMLQSAYEGHFCRQSRDDQLDRPLEDWEARPDFEQLLNNLCVVGQTLVPDLFTALLAAEGTMSPRFCERLAEVLMKFPWVSPRDNAYAGLPVLAPTPDGPGGDLRAEFVGPDGRHGRYFYVDSRPGRGGLKVSVRLPWEWQDRRKPPPAPRDMLLNWPPVDYLLTAMSLRARQVAASVKDAPRVELFEGNLLDGLDVKATLRAQSRGDDRVYVRDRRFRRAKQSSPRDEWGPVVWLFDLGRDPKAHWIIFSEDLTDFDPYARRPEELRRAERELGTALVEQVGYGRKSHAREGLKGNEFMIDLKGIVIYSPSHFNLENQAAWIEDTGFANNPLATFPANSSAHDTLTTDHPLNAVLRARHGLNLDLRDWPTSLIRMAVPFAKSSVTVVAPDMFRLPPVVVEEAARRRVRVNLTPHSYFPREGLRKIARWFAAAPVAGTGGKKFSEEVERMFGEPATANRNLVPPFWRNYGTEGRRA